MDNDVPLIDIFRCHQTGSSAWYRLWSCAIEFDTNTRRPIDEIPEFSFGGIGFFVTTACG